MVRAAVLFCAERAHWIYAAGSPSWNVAGKRRDAQAERNDGDKGHRVGCAHPEEHAPKSTRSHERPRRPDRAAAARQRHSLAQHEQAHLLRGGTERKSDPDFAGTLANGGRYYPVDAHGREQ
jgi:hypothetical protein